MQGTDKPEKPDVSVAVDALVAILAPVCLNRDVVDALDAVREMARLAEERAFEEGQNSVVRERRAEKARRLPTADRQRRLDAQASLREALDLLDDGAADDAAVRSIFDALYALMRPLLAGREDAGASLGDRLVVRDSHDNPILLLHHPGAE